MSFNQPPPGYGAPAGGDGPAPGGFRPPPGYGAPAPGVPPPYGPTPGAQTEPLAIFSLVLGLLSIPGHFCCYLGWPLGVIAIVLGVMGHAKITKEPSRYTGKGLALAGIVCAALGFLLFVGFVVLYGAAAVLARP